MKRDGWATIVVVVLLVVAGETAAFIAGRGTVKQSQAKTKIVYVQATTTTTVPDDVCTVTLPGGYVLHTDKQSAAKSRLHCD